jgi:hypothetical protein
MPKQPFVVDGVRLCRCHEEPMVRSGRSWVCRVRRNLKGRRDYHDNRDRYRRLGLARYGLTLDDYRRLARFQGSRCAVCGRKPSGRHLDVDHEHQLDERNRTGAERRPLVRGLLCHRCNRMLGMLSRESEKALEEAVRLVNYLTRYLDGNVLEVLEAEETS